MTKKKKSRVTDLLGGKPQATEATVESPALDPNDFDEYIDFEEVPQESETTPERDNPKDGSPSEPGAGSDANEEAEEVETEETDEEDQEKKDQADKVKQEVMQSLLDPEAVIAIMDMVLSRAGTIGNKSKKEDWKLDEDEKEVFIKLMPVMMEEENIQFWPAKYWILIAFLLIYGMKSYDVWDDYYSPEAKIEVEKKKLAESDEGKAKIKAKEKAKKEKELEDLRAEVHFEEEKKKLLAQLEIYQQNGSEDAPPAQEPPAQDQDRSPAPQSPNEQNIETVKAEEVIEEELTNHEEEEEEEAPPVKIKPQDRDKYRFEYDQQGNLMYTKKGLPRKRRGVKPGAPTGPRDHRGKFVKK